jgi:hypothetical protein
MAEPCRMKLVGVSHKPQHKVSRYALSPVLPASAVEGTDAATADGMARLIDRRRSRLLKLRQAGCPDLADEKRFTYVMNCPPIGVLTDRLGMIPCGRVPLCPFCWCRRYVNATLERYRRYLFPVGAEHPRVELAEMTTTWLLSFERFSVDDAFRIAKGVGDRQELGDRRSGKQGVVVNARCLGGTLLTTVDVTETGWRVSRRGLLLSVDRPDDFKYDETPLQGSLGARPSHQMRRTRLWYPVDQEPPGSPQWILHAAVGRLARYPEGLLAGNLQRVREIFDFMHGRRLRALAHYGVLRGELPVEPPETRVADDLDDQELSRENF